MIAWGEIERSRDVLARGGEGSIVATPHNFSVYEGGRGGIFLSFFLDGRASIFDPRGRTSLPPSVGGWGEDEGRSTTR